MSKKSRIALDLGGLSRSRGGTFVCDAKGKLIEHQAPTAPRADEITSSAEVTPVAEPVPTKADPAPPRAATAPAAPAKAARKTAPRAARCAPAPRTGKGRR